MTHRQIDLFGDSGNVTELGTPTAAPSTDHMLLLQMTENMGAMLREMASTREAVTKLREDMAVMKVRQEQHYETKGIVEKLEERVKELEQRRHQQDGAMSLADWVRQFGPWLFGMAAFVFAIYEAQN